MDSDSYLRILKISIKDWFMLAARMRCERRVVNWKTELFHKRNQNLQIWKNSQYTHTAKMRKSVYREQAGVTGQPLAYEIRLWPAKDPVMMAAETWKQRRCYPGQICRGSSCLMAWPLRTEGKLTMFWRIYINRSTAS